MAKTATRRRARQQALPEIGPIDGQIKELETLGDELDELRTQRISLQADEKRVQEQLVLAMNKHSRTVYAYNGKKLELTHEEKDKVKVRKPKDEDDD
jgi:hypothetical protein